MKLIDLFKLHSYQKCEATAPYVIAEAGVNHEGDINLAKRLINEAHEGGADSIKFQTYKAEHLAVRNSPAYWDMNKETTPTQFDLFKKHDSFWKNEFETLKHHCDTTGIEFISTPFDMTSALFLNDLMDVFKISSSDITNKPFIEYICSFNKPIILSTGASYLHEIKEAVRWINKNNNPLALLHCVLNYPTLDENAHLGMITELKKQFPENIIGYSDHTLPNDMKNTEIATLLGARIIEKHFTHDKTLPGNDHYHAMDKSDLIKFKKNLAKIFTVIGTNSSCFIKQQETARINARRSLVTKHPIPAGKVIEYNDITWKRPAFGISPTLIDEVIGKKAVCNISADTILQWDHIHA